MPRVYYHHEMEFATTFHPHHHHHVHQPNDNDNTSTSAVLQRLGLEHHHLLTTTAAVHLQQQLQYLRYSEPLELTACPLDLSLKSQVPITPPCTPSPGLKRSQELNLSETSSPPEDVATLPPTKKKLISPNGAKKTKATRKLNFDEDNSSPVSGTIIRELRPDENLVVRKGDIDPAFNVVEITDEAKAELAKIENHIGDYVCRLCKELYEDAFGLAQHRCSRIVHVEYRCPECDKVFNCPANLASHRRWHKPRSPKDANVTVGLVDGATNIKSTAEEVEEQVQPASGVGGTSNGEQFPCGECGKRFRRIAYLRKHQAVHQID